MAAKAVLVIDMLRGFLEEGYPLYCGRAARRIIPRVQALLEGGSIFFVCDRHGSDDPELASFPPHCIEGTAEAEIIPELSGYKGEVIPKRGFSAFQDTDLADRLESAGITELVVCGVRSDICVLHTVADARARGYDVEVPLDCVASPDEEGHRFACRHMERVLGARVLVTLEADVGPPRFHTSGAVLSGYTADVYFAHTVDIMRKEGLNPVAVMEFFTRRAGVFCGVEEVKALLNCVLPPQESEVWALEEGDAMGDRDVVLRIKAPYMSYGLYETAIDGMMAHSSGWATAARECAEAAGGLPVVSFGVRHVHPGVAAVMDYAAVVGGCRGCSSIAGADLAGIETSGTMPHALILIMGDTVKATLAFDRHMPPSLPRVSLVDTFRDEAEESLRVAQALEDRLDSVRLDTPGELGGVTPEMVSRVRSTLDSGGFKGVKIFVSGGVTPKRIADFIESGARVDGFGVGSYISGAAPIDFTADLHEVDGRAIAKRGRTPGITANPRLRRIM